MRHGPKPTTPVQPLTRARLRVLQAVDDIGGDQPVLLTDVAERVGGHPNTSRQQLDALVADGLLEAQPVVRPGRGRRPMGYTITGLGRQALAGAPAPNERTELLKAFAAYLVTKPDPVAEARSVGEMWSDQLPAPAKDGDVGAVIELLEILGFDPESTATEQGPAVLLRSCPLLDLVTDESQLVCELHQGMIDGVLNRIGATEGFDLRPFADRHGCRLDPVSTASPPRE